MPNLSLNDIRPFIYIAIGVILIALFGFVLGVASAKERKYASPDFSEYYASLMQPDHPTASCCGDGDRYFADKTEACTAQDLTQLPNCAIVAVITDDGPDTFQVPDGKGGTKTIRRPHIPVGTRIPVPASKIRKRPIPNPTDRNIIFTGLSLYPYCFEPATLG